MLQFDRDVCCTYFRHEVALVLHHASAWAAIAGVVVVVARLGDRDGMAATFGEADLAVDLDVTPTPTIDVEYLAAYLERNLSHHYAVDVDSGRVHVAWNARRLPAWLDPSSPT